MMETELYRLSTFANWPWNLTARPLRLARSGFFYSGKDDKVQCFSCKIRLVQWRSYERLEAMHKQKSPQCNLVLKDSQQNVPMKILDLNSGSFTTTDHRQVDHPNSNFETYNAGSFANQMSSWMELYRSAYSRANQRDVFSVEREDIIDRLNPDFDLLRKEVVRLSTFHDWPPGADANPAVLAREGLFYTGVVDRVRCAFCRGSMLKWEPTDIPSDEHRKHFPDCLFVRGEEVGNVPKHPFHMDVSPAIAEGWEQSDRHQPLLQMASCLIRSASCLRSEAGRATRSSELSSISNQDPPKYLSYSEKTKRLKLLLDDLLFGKIPEVLDKARSFFGSGDKELRLPCDNTLKNSQPPKGCPDRKAHFPSSMQSLQIPQVTVARANYPVEPWDIQARLDTAIVRAILAMGYSQESIRIVIENRLSSTGDDFPNGKSLLEALFQLEAASPVPSESTSIASTSCGLRTVSAPSSSSSTHGSSASMFINSAAPSQSGSKLQSKTSTSSQEEPTAALSSVLSASETAGDVQSKSKELLSTQASHSFVSHGQHIHSPGISHTDSKNPVCHDDEGFTLQREENLQWISCKICWLNRWCYVLQPCGHVVCKSCYRKLCNNGVMISCPFCKQPIADYVTGKLQFE